MRYGVEYAGIRISRQGTSQEAQGALEQGAYATERKVMRQSTKEIPLSTTFQVFNSGAGTAALSCY